MSETTVAALRLAGCTEVWLGVESGSQKILNAMSKGITLAQVHTARHRLAEAGIRACFFLQLGYPGEAWPELLETIDLIRTLRPDDLGVSLSYPLPGTVFYERVQQQLGAKRNWADSDDLCNLHIAAYQDTFYHAVTRRPSRRDQRSRNPENRCPLGSRPRPRAHQPQPPRPHPPSSRPAPRRPAHRRKENRLDA